MSTLLNEGAQKEISELGKRIKKLEDLITHKGPTKDKQTFETETNTAIAELSYSLVTSNAPLPGIANIVLNYAKMYTNSEIGYVSSIDPQTGNNICHTLTGMIGDSCKIVDNEKGILFPIGQDGEYPALWGHSLNTKKPFYANSPQSHPASTGAPDHHIPLRNFMSVPAMIEEQFFGQISLANALRGYTGYELNGVKRLAAIYALAIQREEGRKNLEKKLSTMREQPTFNSDGLEEANNALKNLLKQRGDEQLETEEKIVVNVNNLIVPNLKKYPKELHPLAYQIGIALVGLTILLPLYLFEISTGKTMTLSTGSIVTIVYVALFASVLAFIFWNRAVTILGANIAGPFIHLIPVFSTILAVLFLGETLTPNHIKAILLIFGGILMTTYRVGTNKG